MGRYLVQTRNLGAAASCWLSTARLAVERLHPQSQVEPSNIRVNTASPTSRYDDRVELFSFVYPSFPHPKFESTWTSAVESPNSIRAEAWMHAGPGGEIVIISDGPWFIPFQRPGESLEVDTVYVKSSKATKSTETRRPNTISHFHDTLPTSSWSPAPSSLFIKFGRLDLWPPMAFLSCHSRRGGVSFASPNTLQHHDQTQPHH